MKIIRTLILFASAIAMVACGKPKDFAITGEIVGSPNMNIYMRYYGNGAVRTGVTAASQGKFEIKGASAQPTIVELLDNEYRVLGRLYMANGDKASVKIDRRNPYLIQVDDNEISHQWALALNALSDTLAKATPEDLNALVEQYISENPQSPVASLMFVTLYDAKTATPARADSVMQSIALDGRLQSVLDPYSTAMARYVDDKSYSAVDSLVYRLVKRDSAVVWRPGDSKFTMLVFSNENDKHSDSITPRLKGLMKEKIAKKMQVVDLSLATDTNSWKRQVKRDTATWVQGWMPGGLFAKGVDILAIPDLPYYIVVDSAGTQIYRGVSYDEARQALE